MEVNKALKDLNSEIDFERCRLDRIKMKYKRECGNFIKRLFSSDENYILKKEAFKDKIANQKQVIKNLEYKVSEVVVLDFNLGMEFLAAVISLVEGEEYSFSQFTIHEIITNYQIGFSYDSTFSVVKGKIGLIARKEAIKELEKEKFRNINSFIAQLKRKNEKCIISSVFPELELFNEKEVPKKIVYDFPYLESICADIVAIKLSNPIISEEEICNEYLKKLRNRDYLKTIKSEIKQKKKEIISK